MKIFLDTANVEEIRAIAELGLLDGVTTNPTLLSRESAPYRKVLEEICRIVPGPVSAEVVSEDHEGMVREGKELSTIAENIVVKCPLTPEGLKAVRILSGRHPAYDRFRTAHQGASSRIHGRGAFLQERLPRNPHGETLPIGCKESCHPQADRPNKARQRAHRTAAAPRSKTSLGYKNHLAPTPMSSPHRRCLDHSHLPNVHPLHTPRWKNVHVPHRPGGPEVNDPALLRTRSSGPARGDLAEAQTGSSGGSMRAWQHTGRLLLWWAACSPS